MPKMFHFYRDKEKARITRNRSRATYYKKHVYGPKRPYTDKELEMIVDRKISDVELAKKLRRSILGIQIKRSRIIKSSPHLLKD